MDPSGRTETDIERLDRNWSELLQELRVAQTGVQFLTGFLLTLPFQPRFHTLSSGLRALYLVIVGLSASATALLITPVSLHRLLFRRHVRRRLVRVAHLLTLGGLWLLGLAVTGVVALIFSVVLSPGVGVGAGIVAFIAITGLWVVLPLSLRRALHHPSLREELAQMSDEVDRGGA